MNRQILLIGIGEMGCAAVDTYAHSARKEEENVHVLAIDTDERTAEKISYAKCISLAEKCRIADILDSIDTDLLSNLFPCDKEKDCVEYFEVLNMNEGAGGWRMKATLALYNYLSNPKNAEYFHSELDKIAENIPEDAENKSIELFVTASLSGGTGSGLLIPLTLYIKRRFAEKGIAVAISCAALALPDILEDQLTPEQKVKAEANAYATLRELNTMNLVACGKENDVDFKIGDGRDGVLGLLYDSTAPESSTPDAMLFSDVYLFRRIPGIRSLLFHIAYLADAIRAIALSHEEKGSAPTASVFDLFTMTKTVYPAASKREYLARALLKDIQNGEWLPFAQRTAKLLSRERGISYTIDKADPEIAGDIVRAALDAAEEFCPGESDTPICALLARRNDPAAPDEGAVDEYYAALDTELERIFISDAALSLENSIKTAKDKVAEYSGTRPCIFGASKRKKENVDLIHTCKRDLTEYYLCGLSAMEDAAKEALGLVGVGAELSLDTALIAKEGRVLHPVYSLVLLSDLYNRLEELLEYRRACDKNKDKKLTRDAVPAWLLYADTSVRGDCGYDTGDRERLCTVFSGEVGHVGSSAADMSLICYDVNLTYTRIKNIFKACAIEAVLPIVGARVAECYNALRALAIASKEFEESVKDTENSYSGRPGTVYYVGATAEEKRTLYRDYLEYLADGGRRSAIAGVLESVLGEELPKIVSDEENTERRMAELFERFCDMILADPDTAAFTAEKTEKNVLEVLLTKDERDGGDSAELAQRKAFCAGPVPMRFYLPDTADSYLYMQALSRRLFARLPIQARDYLTANEKDPGSFVGELLYRAGEYDGEVTFDCYLDKNELCIVRATYGIDLTMIEHFSETSEDPLYYRSYKKALAMEKEQMTALWNPHIVYGLCDDSLPAISSEKREAKKEIGKEEDDPC